MTSVSTEYEMADSGFRQTIFGALPPGWKVKRIEDIATVVRGSSPRPAGDPKYFNGTFIPWLTVAALTNIPGWKIIVIDTETFLTEEGSRLSRTLHPGVVIIANSGATLGVAKILGLKCCANDGIAALLNQNELDERFICYYLNTLTTYLREVVAPGNGQPNLNTTLIGSLELPVPPKPEQRAIAAALGDVDEMIGSLDKLIAKNRAIKVATMQQLLTGRLRLPGFGKGAKGSVTVPDNWKVVSLGSLGRWRGGLTPSMADPMNWTAGEIPWISSSDVRGDEIAATVACITKHAIEKTAVPVLPRDSIVVVMRSGILRRFLPVARITRPMAINQDIKALPPSPSFDSRFIQQMISYRQNDVIGSCMKAGTTVESIDAAWFKAYQIALPDHQEQTAIANVLADMESEIAALERRRKKAQQIQQGMMQALLTGRVRLVQPETISA